jgi:nucleoid DNA-binding protein
LSFTLSTSKDLTVNKAELIEALAKETDLSKAAAGRTVSALVEIITLRLLPRSKTCN